MENKIAEIEIRYVGNTLAAKRTKIISSCDAWDLLYKHWNSDTIGALETFKIILLDSGNHVKDIYTVATGGISGVIVDLRLVFAVVLKSLSVGIVLAHNHPSGNLVPSTPDKQLTKKIKEASQFHDIKLLDHLILAPNGGYYSFADEGLL